MLEICFIWIFQDGSCNGLQHYAALGRDEVMSFLYMVCPLRCFTKFSSLIGWNKDEEIFFQVTIVKGKWMLSSFRSWINVFITQIRLTNKWNCNTTSKCAAWNFLYWIIYEFDAICAFAWRVACKFFSVISLFFKILCS